jgi:RiboL-PSP-HEPN
MSEIVFTFDLTGETTVAAYCLKTDSWEDFLAFKSEAIQATKEGNLRRTNRYLRAALIFLFSHLEGFVHDVEKSHSIAKGYNGSRLCDKTRNVSYEARKHGKLPYLNFRLGKHLRDLIAHPGIEIDFSEEFENKLNTSTLRFRYFKNT